MPLNPITQGRFQAHLKRMFAVKATDPGQHLDPIVKPVAELNDVYQPESRFLRGERMFTAMLDIQNAIGGAAEAVLDVHQQANSLIIVKRIAISGALPTATTQPGRGGILMEAFNAAATTGGTFNNPKDMRYGVTLSRSTSYGTTAIAYTGTWASKLLAYNFGDTVWAYELVPQATVTPFSLVLDQLDVVLNPAFSTPGSTGGRFGAGVWFTTAPTAAWNYTVTIDFFERFADPAEFLPPP